ncbi:hypothetical protein DD829_09015 [Chryseobacterium sp. HMWF035]|nr:hypothetical protein DD829_09015 [Chryseobacterium sp. HMWF035]
MKLEKYFHERKCGMFLPTASKTGFKVYAFLFHTKKILCFYCFLGCFDLTCPTNVIKKQLKHIYVLLNNMRKPKIY